MFVSATVANGLTVTRNVTAALSGGRHRKLIVSFWFALDGDRVFLLSGGGDRSDWVRNIREHPTVGLRLGDADFLAHAAILDRSDADDAHARQLLLEKYASRTDDDLTAWQREALVVAIDLPVA